MKFFWHTLPAVKQSGHKFRVRRIKSDIDGRIAAELNVTPLVYSHNSEGPSLYDVLAANSADYNFRFRHYNGYGAMIVAAGKFQELPDGYFLRVYLDDNPISKGISHHVFSSLPQKPVILRLVVTKVK